MPVSRKSLIGQFKYLVAVAEERHFGRAARRCHVTQPSLSIGIPSHFNHMPGLHSGTRMLDLVEPSVSQDVGLFWAEGETMMPMARALVSVVKALNTSGALKAHLGEPASAAGFTKARDERAASGAGKGALRKAARPAV